jgi:hypothetical protein
MKAEPKEEENGNEVAVVAEKIKSELKKIPSLDKSYPVLNDETIVDSCSDTLQSLFLAISPKFQDQLKIVSLVSAMLNTVCNSRTSMLQVALAQLVRGKKVIEHLRDYAVTSTYTEFRRFKISAGSANEVQVQLDASEGLIQGVSDNFDAALSTQNGVKQTHSLATILIQNGTQPKKRTPIPRLTQTETANVPLEDVEVQIFKGEKSPSMPDSHARVGIFPLKVLCKMAISKQKSEDMDFAFLQSITKDDNVPAYSGYNTKFKRENKADEKTKAEAQAKAEEKATADGIAKVERTGMAERAEKAVEVEILKQKTNIFYKPLIDRKPADPSTMLTAMHAIEKISKDAGQEDALMTCDQQLFRVMVDIVWENPERWKRFHPRLGGMHWLMSFIGSVGKLMGAQIWKSRPRPPNFQEIGNVSFL